MPQAATIRIEQVGDGGVRDAVAERIIGVTDASGEHAERGLGSFDLFDAAGQAGKTRVRCKKVAHDLRGIACGIHADVQATYQHSLGGQLVEHGGVPSQRPWTDHAAMGEAEQYQRRLASPVGCGYRLAEVVGQLKLASGRQSRSVWL